MGFKAEKKMIKLKDFSFFSFHSDKSVYCNEKTAKLSLLKYFLILLFPWLIIIPFSCQTHQKSFDIQGGHRGARGLAPENTLTGFQKAIDIGVTTLEFDIGVTKDRVAVIYHDTFINPEICLQRDGQKIKMDSLSHGPYIKNLTLAEIKLFDCGMLNPNINRFSEPPRVNNQGEFIPTLQELFDLLDQYPNRNIWCNIELKTNPHDLSTLPFTEFIEVVLKVIKNNHREGRVNIQSFQWNVLKYIRNHHPGFILSGLMDISSIKPINNSTPSPWLNGIDFNQEGGTSLGILQKAKDYIDIFSPSWQLITPTNPLYLGSSVREIQSYGFKVIPWTVNNRNRMEALINEGVDGIITDYPNRLISVLYDLNIFVK